MNQEVVKAFLTLISVPLGGETDEEYLEMKQGVVAACTELARAGCFQEEFIESSKLLVERVNSIGRNQA